MRLLKGCRRKGQGCYFPALSFVYVSKHFIFLPPFTSNYFCFSPPSPGKVNCQVPTCQALLAYFFYKCIYFIDNLSHYIKRTHAMPPKPPHQSIIQTEFDERTIGRSTQLLKALIPFLEPSQRKMFGLMVRIIEFNMTLDFFNHNRIPACMFKPPCGDDMLSELKGYCSPEEQKQLDMMLGMIKAQKLQAALNSNPCPPPTPGKPPCTPGDNPCGKPHGTPDDKPPQKPPCDCNPGGGKQYDNAHNRPDSCPPPKPPYQPSPLDMLSGLLSPEQLAQCRKFESLL